jgi:hypothetical protein
MGKNTKKVTSHEGKWSSGIVSGSGDCEIKTGSFFYLKYQIVFPHLKHIIGVNKPNTNRYEICIQIQNYIFISQIFHKYLK